MLKRSGALLLIILYTTTVFGFALNLHYCGKLLASVTIDAPSKNCVGLKKGKLKCCKDKQIQIKVKDAHQNVPLSFPNKEFAVYLPKIFTHSFSGNYTFVADKFLIESPSHAPPDNVAVFIKNCIFRI